MTCALPSSLAALAHPISVSEQLGNAEAMIVSIRDELELQAYREILSLLTAPALAAFGKGA